MTKKEKRELFDKAFNQGYACAISTIVQGHGEDTATIEALKCNGLDTRKKAKAAGVDPYDLDILFPKKSK